MKIKVVFGCVLFGCFTTLVMASLDSSQKYIDEDVDNDKRSLGDVCRCCTIRREPWCCNACVFQFNSPTPFYTRKRTQVNNYVGHFQPENGYPKRGRFRSRSRCGCCFTRRLRWCCDSCSRSYWNDPRGKRSQPQPYEFSLSQDESDFSRDTNVLDTMGQTREADNPFRLHHPRGVQDMTNNIVDIPPFPMDNMRKECLCCILYDAPSCCDRCINAV